MEGDSKAKRRKTGQCPMSGANGAGKCPAGEVLKCTRERLQPTDDEYLKMMLTAPVYDVATRTELRYCPYLSEESGNQVYLKREDEQPVFSFKIRGAYNKMASLPRDLLDKGVLACSAGNHAQGVAYSARRLDCRAVICMPKCTPEIKVESVRAFGGEVVLHGNNFDECKAECLRRHMESGMPIIHPYDDPHVIAGQGTVGMEIFSQLSKAEQPDYIFSAVGGGGLVAGISLYTKRLFASTKVFGVEATDAAAMKASLEHGRIVALDTVGLFADGAAVKVVGQETFRVASKHCDGVVAVTNDEICAAVKGVYEDTRSVVEGAGALGVAGMLRYVRERGLKGKRVVCVASGANMNFNRLRFVAERAQMGEAKEALLAVIISEEEGAFVKMHRCFDPFPLTEFSYRHRERGDGANAKAYIFLGLQVQDRHVEVPVIIEKLTAAGMYAYDVTDNELAKSHGRYLIGGRTVVEDEKLYRFEFPETVGTLDRFLVRLGSAFNITMLHYRNHSSGTGRVLVGTIVPPEKKDAFGALLDTIGYPYCDETGNPVYTSFLR
eukprot:TRINITY_DN8430_c0_g1_i1.p1 TRINITY_DN8430_c0_g1~~TRINITY_DN8430_c0_g1_i1.p1  ORF type:complete len:552 (+),score=189.52 TRINITY_DN8430_c0_g1_i1:63-1718(+)